MISWEQTILLFSYDCSVFGHMNSSEGWVMVKLDFGSVLKRKCSLDDYEMWQPAADLVVNSRNFLIIF